MAKQINGGFADKLDLSEKGVYFVRVENVREVEGEDGNFTVYDAEEIKTAHKVGFTHKSAMGSTPLTLADYMIVSNGYARSQKTRREFVDLKVYLLDSSDVAKVKSLDTVAAHDAILKAS